MAKHESFETMQDQPNNPLHGVTLEDMLKKLVDSYGWGEMGERIKVRCFRENPTLDSSLKFLRKTPWARTKVESLYTRLLSYEERQEEKRALQEAAAADPEQPEAAESSQAGEEQD